MATLLGIGAFVVLLLFAIFFHEFGHFVTARWAGIKVSKFFVGFGPTLWSFRRGPPETITGPDGVPQTRPETEYGIKAFPLGGFVKVTGMSPFEEVPASDEPRAFGNAPAWKRALVLAAGSVTHMVSAFIILLVIFVAVGLPDPDRPTLVVEGVAGEIAGAPSPAARAGLEPGDRIVAVDGRAVSDWEQVREEIRATAGRPISLTIDRGGEQRALELTPAVDEQAGERIGVIGVFPRHEVRRSGPIDGVRSSTRAMGELFTGLAQHAPRAFSPSTLGLGGEGPAEERPFSIVGAGRLAVDLAAEGQIAIFLFLFVQINIFIGLFNMLPLPPLDGGHLLVLGIEKVRRKPVDPRALVPVMTVVLSLLILLALLLLYYDIVSPVQLPGR